MSEASRHSLFGVLENAYGVTPANPAFKKIRQTGCTLGISKNTLASNELKSNRMAADFVHGTQVVGGDIPGELSFETYDDLLEAVFCGTWTPGEDEDEVEVEILTPGTVRRSFSFLRHFEDQAGGAKPWHLYTGCEINTLAMGATPESIITATFGIVGKGVSVSATAPAGSTFGAPTTSKPMNTFRGSLKEGGVAQTLATEITLNLDNGIAPRYVIGSRETIATSIGISNLTGQISVYFENSAILEKFYNEVETDLDFIYADVAGNQYRFIIPRILLTGGQPDVSGAGTIVIPVPFSAQEDGTTGVHIKIYKYAA